MKVTQVRYALIACSVLASAISGCASAPPPESGLPPAPTATANAASLQRITSDRAPEFGPCASSDGKTLLFYTVDGNKAGWDAYSVAAVTIGSAGRRLLAGPGAWGATWTPNGEHIVYTYLGASKPTLVRTPYAGAGMTYITPAPMGEFDNDPDVSPDGSKVAFQTRIGGERRICTVGIDGSEFTVYTEGTSPSWHPFGEVLVFSRPVGEFRQLFTINLVSGQVTQLTTGDHVSSMPDWSPDGDRIVFSSTRDGEKWHVFIMDADGSAVSQLTHGDSEEGWPHWSQDGWIYFSSNAGAPAEISDDPMKWDYADIWRVMPAKRVSID